MILNTPQSQTVQNLLESEVKSVRLCFDSSIVYADFSGKIEVFGKEFDELYESPKEFAKAYNLI